MTTFVCSYVLWKVHPPGANNHLTINSTTTLQIKSTRVCTPTTLVLCWLLQCTLIEDHRRNNIACFQLWGTTMKDQRQIDVKVRGSHVNTKQTGTNKQWEDKECETRKNANQKGKECKTRRWGGKNMKTTKCEYFCEIGLEDSWRC